RVAMGPAPAVRARRPAAQPEAVQGQARGLVAPVLVRAAPVQVERPAEPPVAPLAVGGRGRGRGGPGLSGGFWRGGGGVGAQAREWAALDSSAVLRRAVARWATLARGRMERPRQGLTHRPARARHW